MSSTIKLCPGKEAMVKEAKDLDGRVFNRLVAHRARQLLPAEVKVPPLLDDEQRRDLEDRIDKHLEKIHMGADFLPASFLADGAERAAAVCRMTVPTPRGTSYGTGFLIARGYLMTNNHVIGTREEAEESVAEFGLAEGRSVRVVPVEPERLFLTDRALDFTIVACDGSPVRDIEPVPLLRNPATVTRHERVNIVQHPRARPKEIAIHNNEVIRVLDRVIRYRTDTEPGSSGSPVFNNDWELVALHHAGWPENGSAAVNEGIRISAIVSHLLSRTYEATREHEALFEVLAGVRDTSPYLGFFDAHGIWGDPREIEVPDYVGTADFADIGVWNIEHFNDRVSDQRVEDVADVLARLAMDVMGLVEVERGAMDRLVEALSGRGFSMGYTLLDVPRSQDLAVLYDQETTNAKERGDIAERHKDRLDAETPAGRSAFPRRPIFAECVVGDGNGPEVRFLMIAVHLKAYGDLQSRSRRRLAARVLAEIIEDVRTREDLPIVLCGDFNERLDTDVLAALKASPDLFALTADDASMDAISYVGGSHRSLIDHVLVSRDVRLGDIAGDDAAIVRLDRSVRDFAGRVSDHVPLVFRMIYRTEPLDIELPAAEAGLNVVIPEGAKRMRLTFGET